MLGSTTVLPPKTWGSGPADEWLAAISEGDDIPWSAASKFGIIDGGILLPYWCGALLSAVLTIAPWLQLRFSLRTLLLATTLIAAILGAAAALSR